MKNDSYRFIAANMIIFTLGFVACFGVIKSFVNAEVKNQEAHQYILGDTQDTKTEIEKVEERLDNLQAQIDETNKRIDSIQNSQVETKLLEMQIEMNEVEKIEDLQTYYLTYMDVVDKYSDYIAPPQTIYEAFSDQDIVYLWRMVETETCGADFESRTHVANVAFNRLNDPRYPNTLTGVITASGQFAYVKTNISETTKLACEYAYMFPDNTQGALAFHSGRFTKTFCGKQWVMSDSCGHHFFTDVTPTPTEEPTEIMNEIEALEDPELVTNIDYLEEEEVENERIE